jgi:hypothetical protein
MKRFDGLASTLLAFAIGIFGAMALMHFAVCEQDDRQCAFTGIVSR